MLSPGLKDGWIVDATLGGGGHASALLDATPPAVRLLGVDRDPQALEAGGAALARFGDRAQTRRARFSTLADIVREVGAAPLRAVVLDIGVSSAQLDRAERGFSLRSEGPLDMSMDGPGGERALELLRDTGADELARWLRDYGDVRLVTVPAGLVRRTR